MSRRPVPLRPMGDLPSHGVEQPHPALSAKRLTTAEEDEEMESKRLKRLEKNRESARECRRRKKEQKERLEQQLAFLERENQELRLRLKVGEEAGDAERAEIVQIKAKLDEMVSRRVPEAEILETMDLLKERFADYGSAHTTAAEFHLAQLSQLLLPTLTTRACMHAVLQTKANEHSIVDAAPKRKENAADGKPGDILVDVPEDCQSPSTCPAGIFKGEKAGEGAWQAPEQCPGDGDRGSSKIGSRGHDGKFPSTAGRSFGGLKAMLERSQWSCALRRGGSGPLGAASAMEPERGSSGTVTESVSSEGAKDGQGFPSVNESGDEMVDMWTSLVDVLEATEEQQGLMRAQAGAISELAADLEATTDMLNRLKSLLADRNQTLDEEMDEIQRILSPTQSAKFVLWVSRNEACVHMLNEVWDKLHCDGSPG